MFSETVAQKPTTPVSEGTKKRKNSPKDRNLEGVESIGPKPPALLRAQRRRANPMKSKNGAEIPCRKRIVSMPRRITKTLRSQKRTKQTAAPEWNFAQPGARATIMALMASPPIQVWMPNQPQATRARRIAGMLAPRTPNEARAKTGKGMPYWAPAWALSNMGINTRTLPRKTVKSAWLQFMPPAIIPLASMYVGMFTLMEIQRAA